MKKKKIGSKRWRGDEAAGVMLSCLGLAMGSLWARWGSAMTESCWDGEGKLLSSFPAAVLWSVGTAGNDRHDDGPRMPFHMWYLLLCERALTSHVFEHD